MNYSELIQIGEKSYKQHEIIMLPTNKASKLYLHKTAGLNLLSSYEHEIGSYGGSNQHLYILSSEEIKEGDWYMYCHFGEWIISNSRETLKKGTNTLENLNKDDYFKKIIATTDESLRIYYAIDHDKDKLSTHTNVEVGDKSLPRSSDDFLKAFVKAEGKINEVLVEYIFVEDEGWSDISGAFDNSYYKLKVSSDNTITIKPIQEEKTSWSREELIDRMKSAFDIGRNTSDDLFDRNNWIKQNL